MQFCKEIKESHISIKSENGDIKCLVQCPTCGKNSALNAYWTNNGQEFRVANFQRHFDGHAAINDMMGAQSLNPGLNSPTKRPGCRSGDLDYWKLCDTEKKSKMMLQATDDDQAQVKLYLNQVNEERKILLNSIMHKNETNRLFCRLRPNSSDERNAGLFEYQVLQNKVLQLVSRAENHSFNFDKIFEPDAKQDGIFDCVTPLIRQSLDGLSSCIVAFGLTGEFMLSIEINE